MRVFRKQSLYLYEVVIRFAYILSSLNSIRGILLCMLLLSRKALENLCFFPFKKLVFFLNIMIQAEWKNFESHLPCHDITLQLLFFIQTLSEIVFLLLRLVVGSTYVLSSSNYIEYVIALPRLLTKNLYYFFYTFDVF